ncbi:DEAD/DEAH box helicase [Limosilactobacillus reuteri]|uniref:helicase C-terminal domain-containing protein n=1 Tax=Limosilactobacillus reuteri TaxID=1598 RepID=UPI001E32EC4C|nr:helicase C-terminal domain-containing protein [Limosilactobacillus reuteri]MCC4339626.1 DEAD/DEAH box helicase [Limosilactobacillus reuteri]MCC4350882.1 DEAD/DEAH box helicase [Limosilactobacillus reuteri]MCC4360424.1 DEAD/DEAH box helicase [Limosilactobacillus reuteri]MCC4379027.1 DEAD/DEAH box helicase [Limosilactobacillus reuteri]MCC4406897.1 DEAD/DEAH box helicase [Limosilactobacillus reuteri]
MTQRSSQRTKKRDKKAPIYSVVDLETTGTNVNHGDRIIQIGCVLVQDGEIINHFETKINPREKIPRSIVQLTGIEDKDVRKAPLFEDIAGTIYSLLAETTFVAHNVNFDFPFLNAELERAGYPSLSIPAIDTVTLSQILLPTAKSFRLRDLTSSLHIEHDHPHSAVSDAEATADLLNDLLKRVQELPTLTLEKITQLKLNLPQQTAGVFDAELQRRRKLPQPLSEELYVSHGIVLHKSRPITANSQREKHKYPSTKKAKEKLYGDTLRLRPVQAKMMNSVYNNYTHDEPKNMIVEAGTGVGKTLGYLFPLSYVAYPDKKIVVSTATNILQQQIIDTSIAQLNKVLPFKMNSVIIKGNAHYIDIARFVHSLSVIEDSKLVQLLKAKILVWLLSTQSGDLDELNLNSQQSPYFTEIRHQGIRSLNPANAFYHDDFLVRREKRLHQADIIITNHAYLVAHAQELGDGTRRPYLVIDEAQHLSESILKRSRRTFNFQKLRTAVHIMSGLVNNGNDRNLTDIFAEQALGSYNVELLRGDLNAVEEAVDLFQQALYRQYMASATGNPDNELIEQPLQNDQVMSLLDISGPVMMKLEQALSSVQLHFSALSHLFSSQPDRWLLSDRYLMSQFQSQLAKLIEADQTLNEFNETLQQQGEAAAFWITIRQSSEQSSLQLSGGLLEATHYLTKNVYPYFAQPLFVGATLFTSPRSLYLYHQLDLERNNTLTRRFASPYNYKQNAKLLIAEDAPVPSAQNNSDYIKYLSDTIYQLTKNADYQTMILFNSLVMIEQVYSQLRETDLFDQRDILAQGITGNRDKILKQFSSGKNSILLGASSFWEGIDLPDSALELLIITRLPFDSPDEIMNRAHNKLLQQQGKNPFYHSELPKATMRLRQGIGRLLRTEDDHGVAVVLDPRLQTRRYGKTILSSLPTDLPVSGKKTAELISITQKFLQNGKEDKVN